MDGFHPNVPLDLTDGLCEMIVTVLEKNRDCWHSTDTGTTFSSSIHHVGWLLEVCRGIRTSRVWEARMWTNSTFMQCHNVNAVWSLVVDIAKAFEKGATDSRVAVGHEVRLTTKVFDITLWIFSRDRRV